jgi:hypothetical protein
MRAYLLLPLLILGAALVLAITAYLVMIDVKPRVRRPTPGPEARREVRRLEGAMRRHVGVLAQKIGERNLEGPQALDAAARYIAQVWTQQGLQVSDEAFAVGGRTVRNIIVERRGVRDPAAIVLVGAHYDTAPGTPGANDNATGVALLLEMSRALGGSPLPHTVRYVAFVNEEPPYFSTGDMGSRVHARRARERGERIVAMLSLETLGYYTQEPGTQAYPFPFDLLYPSTGNFLTVVGNLASRRLVVDFLRHFATASDFPVEGAATFEWIPGIAWSDHGSFWAEGYPAIMLTDTAPFRYPQYHGPGDLPDRIAWPEFARAADGIIRAVGALATGGPGS